MAYVAKHATPKSLANELFYMLTTKRPGRSKGEKQFIETYIDTLPGVLVDGFGNRLVSIGDSPILWSSHTDSVHSDSGFQSIIKDGDMIRLHRHERSSCLGADCATGVWLMCNMILRGVPGHYIFHRDEESGGLGSSWIAKTPSDGFKPYQFAIALDRKGYSSVVTHQGGRCCSDAFAKSIAAQLGGKYAPDPTGLFTDTANYTRLVPECTNLSVGYGAQHTSNEQQNVRFALELLEKLTVLDASKLVVERKTTDADYVEIDWRKYYPNYYKRYDGKGNSIITTTRHSYDYSTPTASTNKQNIHPVDDRLDEQFGKTSIKRSNYESLLELCKNNPDIVADWLDAYGITAHEIEEGHVF